MRRPIFISLISLGSLLALTLVFVIGTYFLISSESFIEKQIPRLQDTLASNGVESNFGRIKISPFQGILLEDFKIKLKDHPHIKFNAEGRKLSAKYDLGQILSSKITLDHLHLEELKLELRIKDLPPSEAKEEGPPADINQILQDLLENPPLTLDLKNIKLTNITIRLQIEDPNMLVNLNLNKINLMTNALLAKHKAKINFSFNFGLDKDLPSTLTFKAKGPDTTELFLKTDLSITNKFRVEKNDSWQFFLDEQNLSLNVKDLKLNASNEQHKQEVGLENFSFSHQLSAKGIGQGNLDTVFLRKFLPIEGQSGIDTVVKGLKIVQSKPTGKQIIQLSPSFTSRVTFSKGTSNNIFEDLNLEANQDLKIKTVKIISREKKNRPVTKKISGIQAKVLALIKEQKLKIKLNNSIAALKIHPQKPKASASLVADINSDPGFRAITIKSQAFLNKWKLLSIENNIQNSDQVLDSIGLIVVDIPMKLATILPPIKILNRLGSQQVKIQTELSLEHGKENIIKLKPEELENSSISSKALITINQIEPPRSSSNYIIKYKEPITLNLKSSFKDKLVRNQIAINANKLDIKQLSKALNFNFNSEEFIDLQGRTVTLSGKSSINEQEVLTYSLFGKDENKKVSANGTVNLETSLGLYKIMKELRALNQLGHIKIDNKFSLSLNHPLKTILDLKDKHIKQSNSSFSLNSSLSQDAKSSINKDLLLILRKNLEISNQVSSQGELFQLKTIVKAPEIEMNRLASINNLSTTIDLSNSQDKPKTDFIVGLDSSMGSVKILKENVPDLSNLLKNFRIQTNASIKDLKNIFVEKLAISLDKNTIQSQSYLNAFSESQELQTEGFLSLNLPKVISRSPLLTGAGAFHSPWNIFIDQDKNISIDSQSTFNKLSLRGEDFELRNLKGKILIKENLQLLDNKKIRFSYYKKSNPFNRVDYNLMEPYLSSNFPFSIENIRFKDWQIGPLQAKIEIEQNLLSIPRFNLALFDGNLAGKFFLDFNPKNIRVGLLSRLSKLKPSLLVSTGQASLKEDSHASISARTNFIFNLSKSLVEGKVDITEIGSEQLVGLIDIIDPNYEDDKLVQLRQLLGLGYPTRVTIKMNRGTMDLAVDLVITGVKKTQEIYGIPLTPIIQSKLGDIQNTLKSIPVE